MDLPLILILDYGGQYSHLIARRLRDSGINSHLISPNNFDSYLTPSVRGVILSGGPRSVDEQSPGIPDRLIKLITMRKLPVLGICYGHQLLGAQFGAILDHSDNREYGRTRIKITKSSPLFTEMMEVDSEMDAWMSHGDNIVEVPDGFVNSSCSDDCPVTSMHSVDEMIFGVQFHMEVTQTDFGFEMLRQFSHNICGINPTRWSIETYSKQLIQEMKEEVGGDLVILGVSGGVDSLVAARLLHEAIGGLLHLVFINHGLLRFKEEEEVQRIFEMLDFQNFHYVDASSEFFAKLKGAVDPEKKREIIGHTFISVFEKKAGELQKFHGEFKYLAQGTIFSDRVESGSTGENTAKIKSHHNLTLPEGMQLEILEPLKELYKDEVRKLGLALGLEDTLINRHPFPGPGLAVRILGEVTPPKVDILQRADKIFRDFLRETGEQEKIWQAFAVLLEGKAVGVLGDNRAYGNIIALRAVNSVDGMTADFSRIPWDLLGRISTRIINSLPEVTRVVYDISTKPPATIEFE